MIKVLVPEDVPSLNKGEEAILRGIQFTIQQLGEAELVLFSSHADIDQKRYSDVRIVDACNTGHLPNSVLSLLRLVIFIFRAFINRMKGSLNSSAPKNLFDYYLWADLIILGHDDTLVGPRFPIRIIRDVLVARTLRKPVIVFGGSFVLPRGKLSKHMAKWAFQHMDAILLRDPFSLQQMKELGVVHNKVYLTADAAFLLKPISDQQWSPALRQIVETRPKPMIGMTLVRGSSVFDHAYLQTDFDGDTKAKDERHVRMMALVADRVIEATGATLIFIPHCIGPTEHLDDRNVTSAVYNLMKNKSKAVQIKEDLSAADLKGFIGKLEMMVGERTHSIIQAVSMGVPSLAISFPGDNRTYGIIGDMLGQDRWLYNIERLDVDTLSESILALWMDRKLVAQDLNERLPKLLLQASQNRVCLDQVLSEYGCL